jgi:hypothetical protein
VHSTSCVAADRSPDPVRVDDAGLIELAEVYHFRIPPSLPAYRASFVLARRFRAYGDDPARFMPAVGRFCARQSRDFANFYDGFFVPAFEKVRVPLGVDPMQWAWDQSGADPYPCAGTGSPTYKRFASLCYWLSQERPDRTFFVDRRQLRALSGFESLTVTSCFRTMLRDGLIELVSGAVFRGSSRKGAPSRCAIYRFIGPDPELLEPDAPAGPAGDVAPSLRLFA